MHEVVGIFGSKGDALEAVDGLYELGYGDTEIGFLNHPLDVDALTPTGATAAIYAAAEGDQIGSLYRESIETGSAVVTVAIIEGDELEVSRVLSAAGALTVNSYHPATGWSE